MPALPALCLLHMDGRVLCEVYICKPSTTGTVPFDNLAVLNNGAESLDQAVIQGFYCIQYATKVCSRPQTEKREGGAQTTAACRRRCIGDSYLGGHILHLR